MGSQSFLKNKVILFFSIQTFGLEFEIKEKLEELGASVTYYDERPANSIFFKGIIRLRRAMVQKRIDRYYLEILENSSKRKYDYLFVNRGEVVPEFFLEEFKKTHPNCIFIFYTWDSFTNHSHPIKILKYFDKKFTFDSDDAIKFELNLRPLFFLDKFKDLKDLVNINSKYNLIFLGTAHSDRYKISSEIDSWCKNNDLTTYVYYYLQSRMVYLFKRVFDKSFKEFDFKKLSFKSLTLDTILELYKVSDVILDINHPLQKGLTMRTFEAVGAGKKLITTNAEIRKYCFFNPKNILVIDRNNINIDKSFFELKYEDVGSEAYQKMSIEGWIYDIFCDSKSNSWIAGIKS
tara:strand:- start:1498 stop:2541 length:1044 start_codon:yes stop_codon:yes gene_type:complete